MNSLPLPPFAGTSLKATAFALAALMIGSTASANVYSLQSGFSGAQQVPANNSNGSASLVGTYDDESNVLLYSITYRLDSSSTAIGSAALHSPAAPGSSAPKQVILNTAAAVGRDSFFSGPLRLTAEQEVALKAGKTYLSIESDRFPNGELRGQVAALLAPSWAVSVPITPEENSSVSLGGATPAGRLTAAYYPASRRLTVAVFYTGLTSPTLEAHLHGPANRGEYGSRMFAFPVIPTSTSAVMVARFSLENTQATALENTLVYYCLKTPRNPGGELRGQIAVGEVRLLDPDGDGLGPEAEAAAGTDQAQRDTNGDSLEDGVALALGFDPANQNARYGDPRDSDRDLIPDGLDFNPTNPDSDGDRFLDGYELAVGSDPTNAASKPRLGDIDNNGRVDSVDATIAMAIFLNVAVPYRTYSDRGDVNRDGFFDNADVSIIYGFSLGVIGTLPLR